MKNCSKNTHFKFFLKILIDCFMLGMFICLTKIKITGMHMHEVFGIIVGIIVIVHVILNRKWIKGITVKVFNNNTNKKIKILYGVNLLLGLSFFSALISGILVSVTILTNISVFNRDLWAMIHRKSALITFILIVIHVVMNYKMIKAYCINLYKKIIKNRLPVN